MSRAHSAATDAGRGGCTDLWRRRCWWDHGADSEVGHSGSRNQSPAPREEEVKGQPQVMYGLNEYFNPILMYTQDWYHSLKLGLIWIYLTRNNYLDYWLTSGAVMTERLFANYS